MSSEPRTAAMFSMEMTGRMYASFPPARNKRMVRGTKMISETSLVTNMEEKNTPKIRKKDIPTIEVSFWESLMSGQKMFSFLNPSNTVSIIKSVTSVCQSMLPIRVISGFVISSESAAANSDTASIGSRFNNASSFLITDPSHKK